MNPGTNAATVVRPAKATPEIELVLACACPFDRCDDARVETLVRGDIDWARVVEVALAHGVSPLLARRLGRLPPGSLPDEIRDSLALHLLDNRERNVVLTEALFEILDALRGRGIVALPFKGQTLGSVAYGDFSLRRAGDLDILLRRHDLSAALRILEALGFRDITELEIGRPMRPSERAGYLRYQCEDAYLRQSDGILVEPHWDIAPATMAFNVDVDGFWERAETVPVHGRGVPTLGVPDLLTVLCVHGSKHEWTRLQWICDVAALLQSHPDLDLDPVLANARTRGLERMVLVGLGLARHVFDTALPPRVLQRQNADAASARLVRALSARLFDQGLVNSPVHAPSALRLEMRERTRDRALYMFRTVTTPTEKHLRLFDFPPALRWLYFPVKFAHDYVALPAWQLSRQAQRVARALRTPMLRRPERNLLVVDWVPRVSEGAGFPRMNAILRLLRQGPYRVTFHPAAPCFDSPEVRQSVIPAGIEVIRGKGIDNLERFLAERGNEFGIVMVCRPMNMMALNDVLERHPEHLRRACLVYDSEALFAMRDVSRLRLTGNPPDQASESALIASEVGLAARAHVVLAVSRSEQDLFQQYGARNVHLVGYPRAPCPTSRRFNERRGLLFVGRIADDGWPNADSLLWFRDEVLPLLRGRLADLDAQPILTVAGRQGARSLAAIEDPGIEFAGVVDDLTPLYDRARVFIAPTRFGAGVPIKVYDAAAHGLPVVGTSLVADQLGWQPGRDLLAGDVADPAAFAENILAAYSRPDVWTRLRQNALSRLIDECAPARVMAQLEAALRSCSGRLEDAR